MKFESKYNGHVLHSCIKEYVNKFYQDLRETLETNFPYIKGVYIQNAKNSEVAFNVDITVDEDLYLINVLSGCELEIFIRDQFPIFFIDIKVHFI